jgi:hypothetical protein
VKVLIAAGTAASDPTDVPESVRQLVDSASDVRVLSPTLVGPLQWLYGDIDEARRIADDRLEVILGQLESVGVAASGRVGDESARDAFEDAIRQFGPDHILIAVATSRYNRRRLHDVVDHLLEGFRLPVTIFLLPA